MTVKLKSEKTLGLIGSILVLVGGFIGVIPSVGVFIGSTSLIGQVLVLIALKGLGDKLGDDRPFRYYLYSILVVVGGLFLAGIMVLLGIYSLAGATMAFGKPMEHGIGAAGAVMLALGIIGMVAIVILAIYFSIKAWRAGYEITGVKEFKKTADFLLWGAVTLIILVGFLLLLVAAVYQILAFANMPEILEREKTEEGTVF